MRDCKNLGELQATLPMYFGDLEPVEGKDLFTCKIVVRNYVDKMHVAQTLIKLCAIATHSDGQPISPVVRNPYVDVNRMLELALQFMPTDIDELADEVYELMERDLGGLDGIVVPEWNYSSVRVLRE